MFIALFCFLKVRNWKFSDFNLTPSLRATGQGMLIAIGSYVTNILILLVAAGLSETLRNAFIKNSFTSDGISFTNIVTVSIINPVFEEFFVVGYVVLRIKESRSDWLAIIVSVIIRLLYHLHQGPIGILTIIPMGLFFAYWYVKTEKLWPLIVAHALLDFIGLYVYQKAA